MKKQVSNLTDPTADYCRQYAGIMTKFIKRSICWWYRVYRSFGCTASDSIKLARQETQTDVDKFDFSINFDGPMA